MSVAFVYSRSLERFDYGSSHPLRIERLGLTRSLMEQYGLLEHPDLFWLEAEPARMEHLTAFHTEEYLAALRQTDKGGARSALSIFGLGVEDNPAFPGMYDWSVLLTGASLQAGQAVLEGRANIAFSISGGMHHAFRSRASGFCYINDPVVTIMHLLANGQRVAYVDLDAHHGDGVQAAFYQTDQVLTISLHQSGRSLFPGTGFVREQGDGAGYGYSVSLPFMPYTDSEIYLWAFEQIVPPLVKAFKPDILVTQLGVDAMLEDPLANLCLSEGAIIEACRQFKNLSDHWVALGGGGYDIVTVARCWTLALAEMLGVDLPNELPARFLPRLRDLEPDRRLLRDGERIVRGPQRRKAEEETKRLVGVLKETIFPIHGL